MASEVRYYPTTLKNPIALSSHCHNPVDNIIVTVCTLNPDKAKANTQRTFMCADDPSQRWLRAEHAWLSTSESPDLNNRLMAGIT